MRRPSLRRFLAPVLLVLVLIGGLSLLTHRADAQAPTVVTVDARAEGGTRSGVTFRRGEAFSITVAGNWCSGGIIRPGVAACGSAAGIYPARPGETNGLTFLNAQIGALLGRIGGATFFVGTGGQFTAPGDGDLLLLMNDYRGTYGDNSGSISVTILRTSGGGSNLPPPPPPATPALPPPPPPGTTISVTVDRTEYVLGDQQTLCITTSRPINVRLTNLVNGAVSFTREVGVISGQQCVTGPISLPVGDEVIRAEAIENGRIVASAEARYRSREDQQAVAICSFGVDGVVLFEQANYQGRCVTLTTDVPVLASLNFNDVASSIRFVGSYGTGWEAVVYQHTGYNGGGGANGTVSTFRGDDPDFGDDAIGHDQASAVRIRRVSTDACSGAGEIVVFAVAACPSPPSAPTGTRADALNSNSIRFSWNDTSYNERGFYVHVSRDQETSNRVEVGEGVTSYVVDGLSPGSYRCANIQAFNDVGISPLSGWACATTPSDAGSCPESQYRAEYFDNRTLSGGPAFVRCENWPISHNWGTSGPGHGISSDRFSVRWSGRAHISQGSYMLTARADDHVRVLIGGKEYINIEQPWYQSDPVQVRKISNFHDNLYDITVEYRQDQANASVFFRWDEYRGRSYSCDTEHYLSISDHGETFVVEAVVQSWTTLGDAIGKIVKGGILGIGGESFDEHAVTSLDPDNPLEIRFAQYEYRGTVSKDALGLEKEGDKAKLHVNVAHQLNTCEITVSYDGTRTD